MKTLGVLGSSRKENEHRLPIHPEHFELIDPALRKSIRFESGYGAALGLSDERLTRDFGGVAARADLIEQSDIVLLPKPLVEDLNEMAEGAALWGWPHCVQQKEITQAAIDRKLTLIAWEAMFAWKGDTRDMHLFDRNNEMAGYCGVIHALGLRGKDGHYGAKSAVRVLSHGSVSRGAIFALLGRGYQDLRVYTQRPPWAVHDKIPGCRYGQMVHDDAGLRVIEDDGRRRPLLESLGEADVIVNGIMQDTDAPLMFVQEGEERQLKHGALIVDVSCDLRMGFPFARPTSFEEPTFDVGHVTYYAVDHTPSYLWQAASWELSRVVVSFLPSVLAGEDGWQENESIRRAIEIQDGVIQNEKVLSFQRRAPRYPHAVQG